MAILKKIEVTIEVEGKPLEEYKDDEEEDKPDSITRYVEATTDAAFAIKTRLKRSFCFPTDSLGFHYKLDGVLVGDYGLYKEDFEPRKGGCAHIQYGAYAKKDGRFDALKPFIFNEIEVGKPCFCRSVIESAIDRVRSHGPRL